MRVPFPCTFGLIRRNIGGRVRDLMQFLIRNQWHMPFIIVKEQKQQQQKTHGAQSEAQRIRNFHFSELESPIHINTISHWNAYWVNGYHDDSSITVCVCVCVNECLREFGLIQLVGLKGARFQCLRGIFFPTASESIFIDWNVQFRICAAFTKSARTKCVMGWIQSHYHISINIIHSTPRNICNCRIFTQ